MGLVFKQLAGTAASAVDACNVNDHDVAATASKWGAQVDGSTAATQYTLNVPGITTGADSVVLLAQWETTGPESGDPGETTTWGSGDWICRVNVSQANANVFWDSVEICAYQGGSTTAIASKSGIATSLSRTGTYTQTITTSSSTTVPAGSTILWSFYFGQTIATGSGNTFKIRSNKNLATPLTLSRAEATWRGGGGSGAGAAAATGAGDCIENSSLSSGRVAAGAATCGGTQAGHMNTAAVEACATTEGRSIRAVVASGGVEGASVTEAMTVQGVLAGGGPEAWSIG